MNKQRVEFGIGQMHCASCAVTIEKVLKKTKGVLEAHVNYASEWASVMHDADIISQQALFKVVKQLGYQVIAQKKNDALEQTQGAEFITLWYQLVVSVWCVGLLMVGSFFSFVPAFLHSPWFMWLLATPVQFWVGWRYYKSAWRALRNGSANMDTLIVLGTSVAYGYSVFVILFRDYFVRAGIETHLYFEASATIITFILLGKYLEIRAKKRTSQAIRHLIDLQPKKAWIKKKTIESDEVADMWIEVPVDHVVVDDIVRVRPGDQIPVDAVIIHGESTVNESMVTGESMPQVKGVGDEVIGGTINIAGAFQARAKSVGKQTVLAGIIRLVGQAQGSRAPIQAVVDKISAIFVPIVIVVAIITFVVWFFIGPEPRFLHALTSFVSVLIVACPCALGLATPTSIIVGVGRGAREGILIKSVEMLEVAGSLDIVVFDKTGTLTEGKQRVQDFEFAIKNKQDLERFSLSVASVEQAHNFVASLIVAVETLSNHPVSLALVTYLQKEFAAMETHEVSDFASLSGLGVHGTVEGRVVTIGSRRLMEQEGVVLSQEVDVCELAWSKKARTVSFVALDKQLVAFFCVADSVRKGVPEALKRLHDLGIDTAMITGDNPLSAQAVAGPLGITKVLAQVLPEDKQKKITELQKQGYTVGMVGDGINDAPALAAADIGIAMGGGTEVALETAGAALLRNDVLLVPKLVVLSRATMRNIRQNLVWAFGYNILLIPVAMGILYPFFGVILNPMLAGASMAFSSVSVVLNALRLKNMSL